MGILRYLAQTGRARPGGAQPPLEAETPESPAHFTAGEVPSPRTLREQFLTALSGDRLVLTDLSASSGTEIVLSGRIREADLRRIAASTARVAPGAVGFELWSGGLLAPALKLGESPLGRIEAVAGAHPGLLWEATLDASNGLGARPVPETVLREAALELGRAGAGVIRVREAANRTDRLQPAIVAAARTDALVEACAVLPGDIAGPRIDGVVELLKKLAGLGAAIVAVEDPRGALRPASAYSLVRTIRRELPAIPIRLRVLETVGMAVATVVSAAEAGLGGAGVVALPLARPGAPPAATAVCAALAGTERAPAITDGDLAAMAIAWRSVLSAAGHWVAPATELEMTPPELPTRESIPPRAIADLETILRDTGDGANADRRREAILEAHDPTAYAEGRSLRQRYGVLAPLPTRLFREGMRPGEEVTVALTSNGDGEHRVALRTCEATSATFDVDGAEVRVELGA